MTFLILLSIGTLQAKDINETEDVIADADDDVNVKTYTDLNKKIEETEENSILDLNENYRYNTTTDKAFENGVNITKNITITTKNNSYIDGSFLTRGLFIYSNCKVTIENMTFKNGYFENGGAGIYLNSNSTLIIKNCTFKNNKVYNANGGAINAQEDTIIEIYESVFENNTSIRVSDLEWELFKRGMGSALCVGMGSNVTIDKSTFKRNNGYLTTILVVSYGHVNESSKTSSLNINNTIFDQNTANSNGAIYLDELGRGQILNSIFRNNKITEKRGTLVLDACLSALVKNCLFENNTGIDGAAIYMGVFNTSYTSNVSIIDCNFTNNTVPENGGAIFARYPSATIDNCRFTDNTASKGGAIYTREGSMKINNSVFERNSAEYAGAIAIRSENTSVDNSVFIQNTATIKGGAIYSAMETSTSSNCTYNGNTAPVSNDVYGIYLAHITVESNYFGDIRFNVKLTSPWNMPLSQDIKIKFTGPESYSLGWYKTDSNGEVSVKVLKDVKLGQYTVTVSMEPGVCSENPSSISILRAPSKVTVNALTTKYHSGKKLNIYVTNTKTNKAVSGAKLTLKISNGKKSWTYTLTADANGLAQFDTSKLDVGSYSIAISAANTNIKVSKVKSSITVKKASGQLSAPKSVKKSSKIKITVKNKASGELIKNTNFKVKVYTGKTAKTVNVKTNSKGILKISTKKLIRGKHKINVILKDNNYNINKKVTVKVK